MKTLQVKHGLGTSMPSLARAEFGFADDKDLYIGTLSGDNRKLAMTEDLEPFIKKTDPSVVFTCTCEGTDTIRNITVPNEIVESLTVGSIINVVFTSDSQISNNEITFKINNNKVVQVEPFSMKLRAKMIYQMMVIDTTGVLMIQNPSATSYELLLHTDNWNTATKTQRIEVPGLLEIDSGTIGLSSTSPESTYQIVADAGLRISGQGNGYVDISYLINTKPQINIPVTLNLLY